MELALFFKLGPGDELPLPEDMLLLGDEHGVEDGGPGSGGPEGVVVEVAEEEDDLVTEDEGNVIVGEGLWVVGVGGELGGLQVPEEVEDGDAVVDIMGDGAALGAVAATPEVPGAHLDLDGGGGGWDAVVNDVDMEGLDGEIEREGEEVLAPSDGDEVGVVGDDGSVG